MSGMLRRLDLLAGRVETGDGESEPYPYERDTFEASRDAFLSLAKALNGGSQKDAVAGILEAMTHEHRHLQSVAIWTLLRALGAFGGLNPNRWVDGRNEAAHQACRDIRETLNGRIYWPDFAP